MQQSVAFAETRRYPIDSLNLEYQEYRHQKTGARHIHLAADDDQNAFLVAFLTVPQDSTGVAHILEHTVLCGSERFPVRDPFFMMLRRSLNTFMNAFTASDWTAYPFASRNRKDYFNLLDVYLDATFFPKLNELDFSQEGHRLDFEENEQGERQLVYKGVVFNEMKGAYSAPNARLMKHFSTALFPSITYHHDSGGDPADIPNLTWQQLRDFHALHYHPSNAVILTYGDLPAHELQARFQDRALANFEQLDVSGFAIPDEQRFSKPRSVQCSYPLSEDGAGKTHVVLGWLLDRNSDMRKCMELRVLSDVLLDNSSSPLRHALETSDLGSAPSPLCGSDDDTREMTFSCGLEGTDPDKADAVEQLILDQLQNIADNGVDRESVMSVLHQLELSQREVTGDGFPYGLQLAMRALTPALHGGDPVAALDIDDLLAELRIDAQDPQFIPRLVRRHLLDNQHRVRLVMSPDNGLAAAEEEAEEKRLQALEKTLSDEDKECVARLAADLEERQSMVDDAELLPRVTLADVPDEIKLPQGREIAVGDLPGVHYATGTNGMAYQQLVFDLPRLNEAEIDLLPLYAMCLAEVGSAGRDYRQTQAEQASVLGGLGARVSTRSVLGSNDQLHGSLVISAKALTRNHHHMPRLIHETLDAPDFTELERIRDLISQARVRRESSIVGRGHALAMLAAGAGLSASGALSDRWGGMQAVVALKALDDSLKNDNKALANLGQSLAALHSKLVAQRCEWLMVSEADLANQLIAATESYAFSQYDTPAGFAIDYQTRQPRSLAWAANAQVNYCSIAYAAVPSGHEDAAAFMVLGEYLGNGFLHSAIREKGGAYGGGAGYDSDGAAFRFYSYRDPRIKDTFGDFQQSLQWLLNEQHEERLLEEGILSVISRIDRPGSPAGEAIGNHFAERYGRGGDYQREMRRRVLAVSMDDLQRVAREYLLAADGSRAVIGSHERLQVLSDFEQFAV